MTIFGQKLADGQIKGDLFAILVQVVFEAIDRTAHIEALVRNNAFPNFNSENPNGALAHEEEGSHFLTVRRRLESLRRDLLVAELQVDASLQKIAILCGGERDRLEPLDGYFLGKLDSAISDYTDVFDPNSSQATQYFASNYLLKEGKFPYGHIFNEEEVQCFFEKMRISLSDLIREYTP